MQRITILSILLICCSLTTAQQPAAPAAAQAETVKKTHPMVARSEARIQEIRDQMIEIDADIEKRIDRIIGLVTSIEDTTKSHTKVERTKEDTIEGLVSTIKIYQGEKARRMAELNQRYTNLTKEEIAGEVSVLSEKIDERIGQIMQVTESLVEDRNVRKYNYHNDGYGRGGYRETNPKYRQNQAVATRTANTKGKLAEGLDNSIKKLETENAQLRRNLQTARTEADKEAIEAQIDLNKKSIEAREEDKFAMMTESSGKKGKNKTGTREAGNIEKLIADEATKIEADYRELIRLNAERKNEQTRLAGYRRQYGS